MLTLRQYGTTIFGSKRDPRNGTEAGGARTKILLKFSAQQRM